MKRIFVLLFCFLACSAFTPAEFDDIGNSGSTPSFFAPLKTTLVPTISTASPTFTRTSTATVTDFSGQQWQTKLGEARFVGARRVRNLYTASTTLSTQGVTTIAGTYVSSFSGTGSITYSGSCSGSLSGTGTSIRMAITLTAAAGTCTSTVSGSVTSAQFENVTGQSNQNPSEYVSVGVLSSPYQGANVDGVQYFNYLNGNTVSSNVVTAGVGALITNSNSSYADKNGPFGYQSEQQSTNLALYSRDMTQTNWVKVNTTAALTQTGIDGASNTASLITATAANGTVLQTITQAAASSTYCAYVKRITGTGTITMQQGVTTQTITPTGSWARYCLTATILNPTIGFTLATNGDAIAVDANQFEVLPFPTSWIPTTIVSVTRIRDTLTYPLTGIANNTRGTIYVEVSFPIPIPSGAVTGYGNNYMFDLGSNMLSGHLYNGNFAFGVGATTSNVSWATVSANTVYKSAGNWSGGNTFTGFSGGAAGGMNTASISLGSYLTVGSYGGAGYVMNGSIRNVKIYPKTLSTVKLQAMTTP